MNRARNVFRMVAVVALVAAAVAVGNVWSGTGGGGVDPRPALAEEAAEAATVRIAAQRVEDGRTAFALQVREDDGWGERIEPTANLFRRVEDARVGRWANSSLLELDSGHTVRISARAEDDGRIEFALQEIIDGEPAERILPRLRKFPANPTVGKWLVSSPIELAAREPEAPEPTHIALVNYRGNVSATVRYDSSLNDDGSVTSNVYTRSQEGGEWGTPGFGGSLAVWCWNSDGFQILIDGVTPQTAESLAVTLTIDGETEPSADWEVSIHRNEAGEATHSFLESPDHRALWERLQTATNASAVIDGIDGTHTWNLSDTFSTPIQGNLAECGNYVEGQAQEPPPPTYAPVTNLSGWAGNVQYRSGVDGDGQVWTTIDTHADDSRMFLRIGCWSNGDHFNVLIDQLPPLDASHVSVHWSVDDGESVVGQWQVHTFEGSHSYVDPTFPQGMLETLRGASSFTFWINAPGIRSVTLDLSDTFSTPAQDNIDNCGEYAEGETRTIEYDYVPLTNSQGRESATLDWFARTEDDGHITTNVNREVDVEGQGQRIRLVLGCHSSRWFDVKLNGVPSPDEDSGSVEVTLRVDDGVAVTQMWTQNDYGDARSVFSGDHAARLYQQLRGASSVAIGVAGSGIDPVTFDLTGMFDTPVQANIDNCGMYKAGETREPEYDYVPITSASGWSGSVEYRTWTNDDGSVSSFARAQPHADDDSGLGATLTIACWSGNSPALQIGNLPTLDGGSIQVTLRIIGAEPITEAWNVWNGQEDNDADTTVHTPWSQLTDPQFRTVSSVTIEIGSTDPIVVTFDITGMFDSPVQENLDECGKYKSGETREIEYDYVPWTGAERLSASLQYRAFVNGDGVNTDIFNDVPTAGAVEGRLRFHVSCWSEGTSLNMQVLGFPMGEQRPVEVTITFADGSTHVSNWRVSDWNGNGVQTPLPPNLLARFVESSTVTFTIEGVEYSPMTFDLTGMFETPVQENVENCGMNKRNASRELDLPESPVVSGSVQAPDGESRIAWYKLPSGGVLPWVFAYQFIYADGALQVYLRALCGPGGTQVMVFGPRFGELTEGDIQVTWSVDNGAEQTETWQVVEAFGRFIAHPVSARAVIDAWRGGSTLDITLHTAEPHTQRFHLAELFDTPLQAELDECLAMTRPDLPTPAGEIAETEEGDLTYGSNASHGSAFTSTHVDLQAPSDDAPQQYGFSSQLLVRCGLGGPTVEASGIGVDRAVFIRGYSVEVTWSVDGGPESTSTWDVWPWSGEYYAISPQDDAAFYAAIKGADSLTIAVASDPEFVETYDFAGNGFWETPVQPNLDACVGS